MAKFHYVEGMLLANGYAAQCNEFPPRDAGQSAESWFDNIRAVAEAGAMSRKWTADFAKDMVFCGSLICIELGRFPIMIDWDQDLYVGAIESHTHPEDRDGMLLLTDPAVFEDERPLDAETAAFLTKLASGNGDEAIS